MKLFIVAATATIMLTHQLGRQAIQPEVSSARMGLTGSLYLKARVALRRSGYKPIQLNYPATLCSDQACKRILHISEGECAADIAACNFYWRSPKGRYLQVRTEGEFNPQVVETEWITRNDLPDRLESPDLLKSSR